MAASQLHVTVNGQPRDLTDGTTVADVLDHLLTREGSAGQGVAVAVNDDVVPRAQWAGAVLTDGDRLDVLNAVAGG